MKKGNDSKDKAPQNDSGLNFEAQLWAAADSFRADLHDRSRHGETDFVPVRKDLANPPFNMSDWGGENLRLDVRWKFAMPPVNNANYGWIQHFIHHLSPVGVAGFVMANSASDARSSEQEIPNNHPHCASQLPNNLDYWKQRSKFGVEIARRRNLDKPLVY